MLDFLNSFKSLVKLEQIYIDNNLCKLHYKFTVIMLVVFSILLTSKQYFGEPISCDVDQPDKKKHMDVYCWIHGTFIVNKSLDQSILPGISNEFDGVQWDRYLSETNNNLNYGPNDGIIWQKYYQWVCIVFCFQALLFYIPRYIWKTWEGGRMRLLVKDLCGPLVSPAWNQETKGRLVRYFMSGKNSHNLYAFRYSVCEVLNLLNVILQIVFMDWFLKGEFTMYGLAAATFQNRNPMNQVFPKLTKCKYYRTGVSGSLEVRDALCILPLNVLNEKLFLILWFWLYSLAILTILAIIYRLIVICCPKLRMYLLIGYSRYIGSTLAKHVVDEISYGDFFILNYVGNNVNPMVFIELLEAIHEFIKNNRRVYKSFPSGIMEI